MTPLETIRAGQEPESPCEVSKGQPFLDFCAALTAAGYHLCRADTDLSSGVTQGHWRCTFFKLPEKEPEQGKLI